jgi:hypothetical protein
MHFGWLNPLVSLYLSNVSLMILQIAWESAILTQESDRVLRFNRSLVAEVPDPKFRRRLSPSAPHRLQILSSDSTPLAPSFEKAAGPVCGQRKGERVQERSLRRFKHSYDIYL